MEPKQYAILRFTTTDDMITWGLLAYTGANLRARENGIHDIGTEYAKKYKGKLRYHSWRQISEDAFNTMSAHLPIIELR